MECDNRCTYWLPKKNRFCANARLGDSLFCGNHKPRSNTQWIPCPIDPSHSVLKENLEGHIKRCPFSKQLQSLSIQSFYQKGINAGEDEDDPVDEETIRTIKVEDISLLNKSISGSLDYVASEMKRKTVYGMNVPEFCNLIGNIESIYESMCKDVKESYKIPEACGIWIKRQVDRKLPFQEKHVLQQASILGNLEEFGVLKRKENYVFDEPFKDDDVVSAVVEFGAGRGYLTQMLVDCYGIERVFLVERKSYKLKADRSLRQKEKLILERLRIDIEDLNLNAVESLQGLPFLAIGKHLCGPATDLTLRCCLMEHNNQDDITSSSVNPNLKGLAIATCCHHLCQWKSYTNKSYLSSLGITKEQFHAITWFTSWAVDDDHGSELSDITHGVFHPLSMEENCDGHTGVEGIVRNMKPVERAVLGFKCKLIIDMGRLIWMKERGLEAQLFKYVSSTISPENNLLIANYVSYL